MRDALGFRHKKNKGLWGTHSVGKPQRGPSMSVNQTTPVEAVAVIRNQSDLNVLVLFHSLLYERR